LAGDPAKQWIVITNDTPDCDQDSLVTCLEQLALVYMDRDISLDTKEWLQQVKKPRSMTVQTFLARLCHINDLIEHMPLPLEGADEDDRVPKFSISELSIILRNACPRSWRDAQVTANQKYMSLTAQANYFSSLKKLEDNKTNGKQDQRNGQNKRNSNGKSNHCNSNGNSNKNNRNQNGNHHNNNNRSSNKKNCAIHGQCNHTTKECDFIKNEKNNFGNW
jgi:hypothetical protein